MGNNSFPKFIFRLSRFPVYRGFVLGRFYCIIKLFLMRIIRKPTESKKGAQLSVLVKLLHKKQKLRVDGIFWVQFYNKPYKIILKCLCYSVHVFCHIS